MNISKESFFSVGAILKIPQEQLQQFWTHLQKEKDATTPAPFSKYLYYLGETVVISAMTWLLDLGWELFGGRGIFILATLYALAFLWTGRAIWNKKELRTPAGLLITLAVCMVPLAIFGLETYFGLWPDDTEVHYHQFYELIDDRWIWMELGTILAGVLAIRFFPFPFLTAPIFFAAWFLSMDIAPLLFGKEVTWDQKCWISMFFGIILIIIGLIIDRRKKEDFAFWSYLFGTFAFWGGLNCLVWDKGEGVLFVYFIINLLIMSLSVFLRRNVLMVFGALGVFGYLSHLVHNLFPNSIVFPFILSFMGLGLIYLGILYQKNLQWIEKNTFEKLPPSIKAFLDFRRED